MARKLWTEAELDTVRKRYPHEPTAVIARDLGRSTQSTYSLAHKMGLKKTDAFNQTELSGRIRRGRRDPRMVATQFRPGHVPANKGLRRPGWAPGCMAETQFKRGELNGAAKRNYVPIGSTRIVYGNLERKTTDDPTIYPAARWKPVHRLVWEAVNGPVPKGCIVVFKPGMHTIIEHEITLDRLACISRAENMRRNTVHRYGPEIAGVYQLKGALTRQINKAEERHEKQD